MIKLTAIGDGKSIYFPIEQIGPIHSEGNVTHVVYRDTAYLVKESPEQVVGLVAVAKERNTKLQACYQATANSIDQANLLKSTKSLEGYNFT